jgi:2-methylcitrate dehydratase PrpD
LSLSRDIVERYWAVGQVDPAAADAALVALADGLAVMAAAVVLEPAVLPFLDHAEAVGGAGRAKIIGRDAMVSAPMAALAHGALSHALDFEDTFEAGMIHPNASLLPAVLALAQAEGAGGTEMIRALAIGCDFACRLSLALSGDPAQRGWYHPPILSGMGATLGAAALLRLSPDAAINALGLFSTQFMLADELKRSPASHLRAVREGLAARAAVDSVLLARAGVVAVEQPLEGQGGLFAMLTGQGPRPDALLADLRQRFYGPDVAIKRWPCCRGTHSAIVAAEALRTRGIGPEDIALVEVVATPPNDMLFVPVENRVAPRNAIDAKFSIPFVFAVAFGAGDVTLGSFAPDRLHRPDTLALSRRVRMKQLVSDVPYEARYDVTLRDGSRMSETVSPIAPWRTGNLLVEDLTTKVAGCLAHMGPGAATAFLSAVDAIRRDGIEPVMRLL